MLEPIVISMDAQEIGAFTASGVNPDQYRQLLLAKLKDAGGPVEGTLTLKLATGQLFKKKDDLLNSPHVFYYVWLPEALCVRLAAAGGVA